VHQIQSQKTQSPAGIFKYRKCAAEYSNTPNVQQNMEMIKIQQKEINI